MSAYLWPVIGLAALVFLVYRAWRIWIDAGRWGFAPATRLGWALEGAIAPSRYWWKARLDRLPGEEQAGLLARETEALGLRRADGLRCPLCGTEVPRAWTLTSGGQPAVAQGPTRCPACDFRLDACRHCAHFLAGSPQSWGQITLGGLDLTFGRCGHYKASQPVEQVCTPDMARQLKARGYEQILSPLRIVDSFLPPDSCQAFQPGRKRLKVGGVAWPGARRTALLRLLAPPAAPAEASLAPAADGLSNGS